MGRCAECNDIISKDAPIVVGGVGGSGTRVLSEFLQRLGVYMGADLNKSEDNLWFTLLFRRNRWYLDAIRNHPHRIQEAIDAFSTLMTSCTPLNAKTRGIYLSAAIDRIFGTNKRVHSFATITTWTLIRLYCLLRWSPPDVDDAVAWGWKEPNSHIYLRQLAEHFPQMKYVHVIRHGLDMAYSTNLQQLQVWGDLFSVDIPSDPEQLPNAALDYWIRANTCAVDTCNALLEGRYLILSYDKLCLQPEECLYTLLDFLELPANPIEIKSMCERIRVPSTMGRYKENDLSIFSDAQFEAVRSFGFDVDR